MIVEAVLAIVVVVMVVLIVVVHLAARESPISTLRIVGEHSGVKMRETCVGRRVDKFTSVPIDECKKLGGAGCSALSFRL